MGDANVQKMCCKYYDSGGGRNTDLKNQKRNLGFIIFEFGSSANRATLLCRLLCTGKSYNQTVPVHRTCVNQEYGTRYNSIIIPVQV